MHAWIIIQHERTCFRILLRYNSNISLLGEKNMTCGDLANWVNEQLSLNDDEGYTESMYVYGNVQTSYYCFIGTICNWLHLCGFKVTESRKGIYYDGHERQDVVEVIPFFNYAQFYTSFGVFTHRTA